MIIKGRSPTMRHVLRTQRVALDWLFDRIKLDPKIQIRYIDSKHQLADILTEGNFTRVEWKNLLHLFNVSNFSSLRCTQNFRLISCITMAKRIQEQKGGERVVSKSRPEMTNISSYLMSSSSSAASSPIASKSPWMSAASWRPGSRMNLEASSFDAASASQVRLKDALLGGLVEEQQGDMPHEKNQFQKKKLMILNLSPGVTSLLLKLTKFVGNHLQEKQENPSLQRFRKVKTIKKRHWNTSLPYRLLVSRSCRRSVSRCCICIASLRLSVHHFRFAIDDVAVFGECG